jgi:hypothetical protein
MYVQVADVHGQGKTNARYMILSDYLTEQEPYTQYIHLDFNPKLHADLCELGFLTFIGQLGTMRTALRSSGTEGFLCIRAPHIARGSQPLWV